MDTTDVAGREGFGQERYENVEFQTKVHANFKRLLDLGQQSHKLVLDATDSIENLHEIIRVAASKLQDADPALRQLW